ncbi:hypothetical protein FJZ53_01655 [Candidatus Woesearchaeota archaeon]|nr:hypothetical protein [Candidatus Woesearchaeota archaeon]
MKIPEIFIPDSENLDKKLKDLKDGKSSKLKQVKDLLSLTCIPKEIGDYVLRTDFEKLKNKKILEWHFGKKIPEHIIQAGEMTYIPPLSNVYTSIYFLEFKNGTDLKKLNQKISLEKEISQIGSMQTKCLKKDNYLIAIKANRLDKYGLDVFKNWYLDNFELEAL